MTEPMSERTTLHRYPQRGRHDRATIDAVIDEGLIAHLGFVHDGRPVAIPTVHARLGDTVYLHGSVASRAMRTARTLPVCITVTLLDGLVLARCAAPPRQRACLVLDHGVHALPQVLHAIVRFRRKKLERKERLCAGAAQRAAGRSRAPRQRRTSPLATLSLILSTICAPASAGARYVISTGCRGATQARRRRCAARR